MHRHDFLSIALRTALTGEEIINATGAKDCSFDKDHALTTW